MTEWVDMGNQEAISPQRVGGLWVRPPMSPSGFRYRVFAEQINWCVMVQDERTNVTRVVGMYPAEDPARAHARRILDQMLRTP